MVGSLRLAAVFSVVVASFAVPHGLRPETVEEADLVRLEPRPRDAALVHAAQWNASHNDSTYLAIRLAFHQPTNYRFAFQLAYEWNASPARFTMNAFITNVTSAGVRAASLMEEAEGACSRGANATELRACPPTDLRFDVDGAGFQGRVAPGEYVLVAAGFGASRASIAVNGSFEHAPVVAWVREGTTKLLVLDSEDSAARDGSEYSEEAKVHIDRPFFGVFRTVGSRVADPSYVAARNGTVGPVFATNPNVPLWTIPSGAIVMQPSFGGTPGSWTFLSRGGERANDRASSTVLGLLQDAPFVAASGILDVPGAARHA